MTWGPFPGVSRICVFVVGGAVGAVRLRVVGGAAGAAGLDGAEGGALEGRGVPLDEQEVVGFPSAVLSLPAMYCAVSRQEWRRRR
jgi:hypothetical protein